MRKLTDPRNLKKPFTWLTKARHYVDLRRTFRMFKKMSEAAGDRFPVTWENIFFITGDNTSSTAFDAHYVYHPAWAARVLAQTKPAHHIDISSTLHFCSIISAFIPTTFYDYRPAKLELSGLTSKQADLLALPFRDNSIASLSCMHTIEHIGLGRYGDPLDPDGDLKAIRELKRVVQPGGDLLLVVPIGTSRVLFNAHRIYSYAQILDYVTDDFELRDFFLIPDDALTNGVIYNAEEKDADAQSYGCGCFWFKKL